MPYKKQAGQEFGSSVDGGGALMLNSFLASVSVLQGAPLNSKIYIVGCLALRLSTP
jgi:hypothetical protein